MKYLIPLLLAGALAGCDNSSAPAGSCSVYVIGPAHIEQDMKANKAEPAPGKIEKSSLPADFPPNLVDGNGNYRGMDVYCKTEEAKAALAQHPDWQIYELDANWKEHAYQADDGHYHLRTTSPIKQAVH